jgi:amidophosphoribosyltransferase
LREAGATEVHMRISSPPYKWPCFYGMDTGQRGELLAANLDVGEIQDFLNVDSLTYLSLDRLLHATGAAHAGFCAACLTGEYPVEVPVELTKAVLESSPVVDSAPATMSLLFEAETELPAEQAEQVQRTRDPLA